MKLSRENAVALFQELGYQTCDSWNKTRMQRKLDETLKQNQEEAIELEDEDLNDLWQKLIAAGIDDIQLVEDEEEEEEEVKETKAISAKEEDEEDEEEEEDEEDEDENIEEEEDEGRDILDEDEKEEEEEEDKEDENIEEEEDENNLEEIKPKKRSKTKKEEKPITLPPKKTKIVYPELEVTICKNEKAITVEKAKELLGWEEQPEDENWGSFFAFKLNGVKVRLNNNPTNRPFRMSLAKRYASEFIRDKWALNGETIVVDQLGDIRDAQHRLVGLVLSGLEVKDPTMDVILVTGIEGKPEIVNTIGLGLKRSLGDVLFRQEQFELSEKESKRIARTLASAVRLVWLRVGGKKVSDAPHFPHSEALSFLEQHPKIKDSCIFIHQKNDMEGKIIKAYLSLAYAAGMHYLMSTCTSEDDSDLDFSNREKADRFWSEFASGAELAKGSPILSLRDALKTADSSGSKGRDIICCMIAKAWNAYKEDKPLDMKGIRISISKNTGNLREYPRVGGIDVEV